MASRGPDGRGLWSGSGGRVILGHRRLSIIDLSDAGRQPMLSPDGRLAIVLNGEIYNYRDLRRGLEAEGASFKSESDTEVLLQLYARRGPAMLVDLRGMFALAIWDEARKGMLLARDPYGIKPLYVSDRDGVFRFASQVKALLAGGGVSRDPDPAGALGFLVWGAVPEPFTLYRHIQAFPAGCSQWVDQNGARQPEPYVDLAALLRNRGDADPDRDRGAVLRAAVLDSVANHLVSDVEVGVFLSAGVDSGAILGLTKDAGLRRVRAVTLAFKSFAGSPDDEAPLAAQTARLYGAEHHVRRVDRAEFEADLPNLLAAMDQPSIDGVNTWFVSKAARERGLKVALSGLGGDELLGGYPSFDDIPRWVRRLKAPARMPGLGVLVRKLFRTLLAHGLRLSPKIAGVLEYGGSYEGAYLLRRGLFLPYELDELCDPGTVREGIARLRPLAALRAGLSPDPAYDHGRVAVLESRFYMRNQLLRDADWAGMAHSLEIRTPLVDVDLLRRVAPLLPTLKPGEGKSLLAAAPSIPLPKAITSRAKTGFLTPLHAWRAGTADGATSRHAGGASRGWALEVLKSQAAHAT